MKVQLCLVALSLSILRGTYSQQTPDQGGCSEERYGDLRLVHKQGDNFGALQVCAADLRAWKYFIDTDWTVGAARLACMQLGLPSLDPVSSTLSFLQRVFIRTVDGSCVETAQILNNCIENPSQARSTVLTVNCTNGDLPREECTTDPSDTNMAECTTGSIRLVDGVRYREGRVEVCVDGRWGTVCSEGWTESDAGNVCSRLGYPSTGATIRSFGEGTGTVYNLVCQNDCQNQAISSSSCDHSMDLGVRCQSHSVARVAEINEAQTACEAKISEAVSSITTVAPRECPTQPPTMNTMPVQCPTQPPLTPKLNDIGTTEQTVSLSTMLGLGAFTGLATAALMGVIVGWIITCAYYKWKKRLTEHTASQSPTQAPQSYTDDTYDYINEIRATPTVSCDLTSNEAYHSVQCVTNDSYSVVP